jgi:signal transduction histidine kinase
VKNDKKLLVITTIDTGIGFNYNTVLEENEGNGLRNIINRIELIGGEIFIETDKGKGVKYTIQIPQTNESES